MSNTIDPFPLSLPTIELPETRKSPLYVASRASEEPGDGGASQVEDHTPLPISQDRSSNTSPAIQHAADGGVTLAGGRPGSLQTGAVGGMDGDSDSEVSTLPPPYSSEIDYN